MNTLNLNKATQLYEIIGKYIPEVPGDDDVFGYVYKILENIKNGDSPEDYFYALELMTGKGYDELSNSQPVPVLELFIDSLMEWHIIELASFFKSVGYKT